MESSEITWSERVLRRARYVAQGRIGAQVLESMRAEVVDSVIGRHVDGLIYRLSTEVFRESVGSDTHDVPFTTDVPVKVPPRPRRWSALAGFALAGAMCLCAIALASLALAIASMFVASLAVWTLVEPMDDMPTIAHVNGKVTVRADAFNTYPENNVALPPGYGRAVRVVEMTPLPELYGQVR